MTDLIAVDDVMYFIMSAGSIMLESGAETYRVEETIYRIAKSWGMVRVEPFATPTGLVITLEDANGFTRTEVKRISRRDINLNKVVILNDLSRQIVGGAIDFDVAMQKLRQAKIGLNPYPGYLYLLAAGIGSGALSVLFHADLFEFMAAAIAGWCVHGILALLARKRINRFMVAFVGGAVSAGVAIISHQVYSPINVNIVITGAIMTLVPGVAITNAIRDIIHEDLLSGASRGLDAFLTAMAIAGGAAIILGLTVL